LIDNYINLKEIIMIMKKRGVSKFISTVILVGFVIALLVVVFMWGKGFIEELAEKRGAIAEKELECQSVEISVRDAFFEIYDLNVVLRNTGSVKVDRFIFRLEGDKSNIVEKSDMKLSSGFELEYVLNDIPRDEVGNLERVVIIPHLKAGPGKFIPCDGQTIAAKM